MPPLVVEIAVGVLIVAIMTLLRFVLVPLTGDRAPFAFVFVAVVGAAVLAGWRSGLLALVLGQLLAWKLIVDASVSGIERLHSVGGFVVASLAQLMALVIILLYQREVDRAWVRREVQVDFLHKAMAEIDHRTANNYQTVLALILAQARRADVPVKQALEDVANRIKAIAVVSKQLAISSDSLEEVHISEHLGELCAELRQGLARPGVTLDCRFDDVHLSADETTWVSILVNELVTNALKHAFPDNRQGAIFVSLGRSDGGLMLEIADDGIGMKRSARSRGTGVGSRLVDTFVKQLGASHEVDTGSEGTRHMIRFAAKP